jgi:hypothetical protein
MVPAARRGESVPAEARPGVAVLRPGIGLALPARLPFERWLDIGMQLSAATTSVAWCLGDWLAFGERAYAGRYRQAVEATCLDYQTLRNYAWVARRFAMSRRPDTLSFGHHAEVGSRAGRTRAGLLAAQGRSPPLAGQAPAPPGPRQPRRTLLSTALRERHPVTALIPGRASCRLSENQESAQYELRPHPPALSFRSSP